MKNYFGVLDLHAWAMTGWTEKISHFLWNIMTFEAYPFWHAIRAQLFTFHFLMHSDFSFDRSTYSGYLRAADCIWKSKLEEGFGFHACRRPLKSFSHFDFHIELTMEISLLKRTSLERELPTMHWMPDIHAELHLFEVWNAWRFHDFSAYMHG